jgi:D-alanyl-lipoteichoic acid acyltransferase DltB (MBOAT superfamily)
MLFPTIDFLIFFIFVFAASWGMNSHNGAKKLFLVIVSYYFYSRWDWHFIFLLAASSIGNYALALLVGSISGAKSKKTATGISVVLNLGLLGYFKYYDFISAQVHNLLLPLGVDVDLGTANVALPVAISFLTFHGISYVVDVHRGKVEASRSLVDVMLYMAFFPHLVAGPIVRAADFLQQLAKPSDPRKVELGSSMILILGGLFKKVVIAGHLSTLLVDPVFADPASASRLDLFMAMVGYAVVIFCDFSAYTDIATGVANLLGYHFPPNFNQPYRALSLQDFWRRWHITLSSWLRDYLYIPLGGSRAGRFNTYRNLFIVMLLGGLWHGAGLQFIVWGALHGIGLAIERALGFDEVHPNAALPVRILRWAATFAFVIVAWVFFRSPSLEAAMGYFRSFGEASADTPTVLTAFTFGLIVMGMVIHFLPYDPVRRLGTWLGTLNPAGQSAVAAIGIAAVTVMSPAGIAPFIYFQF